MNETSRSFVDILYCGMSGTVCRYPNVSAYDHSRVVISHNSADLYINANIVKAPEADREYILTQGVLKIYMEDELTICVSQGL